MPLNTHYTLHAERYTRMRVRISALKTGGWSFGLAARLDVLVPADQTNHPRAPFCGPDRVINRRPLTVAVTEPLGSVAGGRLTRGQGITDHGPTRVIVSLRKLRDLRATCVRVAAPG